MCTCKSHLCDFGLRKIKNVFHKEVHVVRHYTFFMYGKLNLICLQLTPNFSEQRNSITSINQNLFKCDNTLIFSCATDPLCVLFKIVSTSCYLFISY